MISVCIPAFNRVSVLPSLLDSVLSQDFENYQIVICEDDSPQRAEIRAIVQRYTARTPNRVRYFENERNLGFDGNLRRLIEAAEGDYCLFMGNDDLMCPGALRAVATALQRYPNVGVVIRSYQSFCGTEENVVQTFRYFPEERFFPAGPETVITAYRRSVVIPGMVIHRDAARKWASAKFDGTLLYQLYVIANILVDMNAVFLPQILVLYRNGGVPDFGNSDAERGKFVPQDQTIESSLHFMRGMLGIAAAVNVEREVPIYRGIVADIANYSYPVLAIQRGKPVASFVRYWWCLGKMGFVRFPMFHIYFFILILLGTKRADAVIGLIKRRIGYTPTLGGISRGKRV